MGLSKSLRTPVFAVVLALLALALPLSQEAFANHGNRTLDVEPETGTRAISDEPGQETQPYVITATLSSAPTFATGSVSIDFENESGPNDTDGTTLNTPDKECSVPAGSTSCSISYTGEHPGTDTWRVWIDHDGLSAAQGGTTEADTTEGRNESTAPGNPAPPQCPGGNLPNPPEGPVGDGQDCTDVVQVTWTSDEDPPEPSTLDCDDSSGNDRERETNPHASGGSDETYTCFVKDQYGNPARDADPNTEGNQAITVKAEVENNVNDPDDSDSKATPDYTCQTPTANDGNGQCPITITQAEDELGTAEICFWVGSAEDGDVLCPIEPTGPAGPDDGDNLADRVELTWEEREADSLDLETEAETLTVGAERSITATIYDQFETPYQGDTTVYFEFFNGSPNDPNNDGNTPQTPDAQCSSVNDTTCEYSYTGAEAGRDLICGWIGDAPAMQGNARNAKGTCNEEGRIDEDDDETQADAPQEGDNVDVVETTFKNAQDATSLECTPEWHKSLIDTEHTVRCTVDVGGSTEGAGGSTEGFEIDFELTGTSDPDSSNSRTSPDKTCRTNANGVCSIKHSSSTTGKTSYTAWVDADYENSTVEADPTEGRNEKKAPGDTAEPDTTDKVQNKWADGNRSVRLWKSPNEVQRGDKVRAWGKIKSSLTACAANQVVKLKSKVEGSGKGFQLRRTRTTDGQGAFDFGKIRIWKETKLKAVAPQDGACDRAVSNVRTVTIK